MVKIVHKVNKNNPKRNKKYGLQASFDWEDDLRLPQLKDNTSFEFDALVEYTTKVFYIHTNLFKSFLFLKKGVGTSNCEIYKDL